LKRLTGSPLANEYVAFYTTKQSEQRDLTIRSNMSASPSSRPRIVTILPCTSISSATTFFTRLGFTTPTKEQESQWEDYLLLSHPQGLEIHLRQLGPEEQGWLVPEKNPFGLYVYTPEVARLAVEFKDEIIEESGAEVKEWGMLEFSVNGPDGCLVRVGWPAAGAVAGALDA
jgi:hypothetical protein